MALEAPNIKIGDFVESTPEGQTEEQRKLAAEIEEKFTTWRNDRLPHEIQWFLNGSFVRGLQFVHWNHATNRLELSPVPPYRVRLAVNRIFQKYKMRRAKFLQNRFEPEVVPASNDREDKLDARMTQRVLTYIWQKTQGVRKYRTALDWSMITGKGLLWVYWDPTKTARIRIPNALGEDTIIELPLGDVAIEAGSTFELLVPDPGAAWIGDQPEIMRVKAYLLDDVKARYGKVAESLKADAGDHEIFQYQRQLAALNSKGTTGLAYADTNSDDMRNKTHVIVKELFVKPNSKFPKGRHIVSAGGLILRDIPELPYGFWDMANPYPCVEFNDTEIAGQFWGTTVVEQMIGIQKEFNLLRSKAAEQLRLQSHPKIIVSVFHKFPKDAWTSEPGEVIPIVTPPGVPPPQVLNPPSIAADLWRTLQEYKQDFDDVTGIYPASQGQNSGTTSGFQVSLLQEAADSVHMPDIQGHELALEELMYKVRRMMKLGYTVPRLISVAGRNAVPEIFEFSSKQIDEHAEIRVFTGSGLSPSPSVRTKQLLELQAAGIFGPPGEPRTARKLLSALNLGGVPELQEEARRDEDLARLENVRFERGARFEDLVPMPWEDHEVHWDVHTDLFKSPEFEAWAPEAQREAVKHAIFHATFVDPNGAMTMAINLGLTELIPHIQAKLAAAQGAAPAAPAQVPPQQAGPPASEQAPPVAEPPPAPAPPPEQAVGSVEPPVAA